MLFHKGDKVQDIYTGDIFTVKTSYRQNYAGHPDQTVEFEPAMSCGRWQDTPWNKESNLRPVTD